MLVARQGRVIPVHSWHDSTCRGSTGCVDDCWARSHAGRKVVPISNKFEEAKARETTGARGLTSRILLTLNEVSC